MKSDFALAKEELQKIGIKRVAADFYTEPKRKGAVYFVKSPATHDRTASLAIYPNSNRFCDFANGNYSGDIIGFISYIRGTNNWKALQILKDFYGLMDTRQQNQKDARKHIQLQQQEEHKKADRKQAFYMALHNTIDYLKCWENNFKLVIEKRLYEPFSDLWVYCVNELQMTEYKLDILCAADCKAYPRMKACHENLPSDRYKWLLDVLGVLQEYNAFTATEDELKEIKAQAVFEVQRKSGTAVRRCKIEW